MENRRHAILIVLFVSCIVQFGCKGKQHATKNTDTAEDLRVKKKYAAILEVQNSEISNLVLYKFIDDWYGTPYKSAGKTKSGVDCSGFVSVLFKEVYKKTIGGPAAGIFEDCSVISEKNLEEGDLVFFKIKSDKISHVGVYLKNRRFVHASTHKGVLINSLDEAYYKLYFFKGGRIK